MAVFKSLQFLPEIFVTETNKKFLNATVDQLVSEPNLTKINGYIGRKLSPSFKATDSYIIEPTKDRQNYQLEPAIIISDPVTQELNFATTYTDIINKIGFYGGLTNNHNRLFDNEYYSYDPQIDLDKFINFVQYYWLENGPDAVQISATNIPLQRDFEVVYNATTDSYNFVGFGNISNPFITLARGGTYTFTINEPNNRLYLQAKPGTTGVDFNLPNIDTREVLGVSNNGQDVGTVSFTVPSATAQLQWSTMPVVDNVNFATSLSYQSLQGCLVSDLDALGGLDGPVTSYDNVSVVFVNNLFIDDVYWHNTARVLENVIYTDQDDLIPLEQRTSIFQLNVYPDDQGDLRIFLNQKFEVFNENKVRITAGVENAGKEFFKRTSIYNEVPFITASLNYLYYQSDQSDTASGIIRIIDSTSETIDPATEIVGQLNYISPSGVSFTNGLKITFDSTALTPYTNNTYYVEGVGTGIKLVPVNNLVSAELDYDYSHADYITINRSSLDQNAWSRSNRWFHVEVIEKTAEYNNTELVLNQNFRAQRPIIEFNSGLQLYNFGTEAKDPIDVLDKLITNAFLDIQGTVVLHVDPEIPTSADFIITVSSDNLRIGRTYTITSIGTTDWLACGAPGDYTLGTEFTALAQVPGTGTATDTEILTLSNGDRVVFTADENLSVRNQIYNFSIEYFSEVPPTYRAYLEAASDSQVLEGHTVAVNSGSNGAKQWHFNGTNWIESQQKTAINQPPKFDIVNDQGLSLASSSTYLQSDFAGTKLFSYKIGTGSNDSVLGFPVSYKNLQTQGDLLFENNYDLDTFTSRTSLGFEEINNVSLGFLQKNLTRTTSNRLNIWQINDTFSEQYQIFNFIYDGQTNLFPIDILPNISVGSPNIKISINNQKVANGNFAITQTNSRLAVLVNPALLTVNDVVFISIFNAQDSSQQGFYEIPVNFDINALNNNITSLTLGQIRNHLIAFKNNSTDIVGEVPGKNNLRDIFYTNRGGSILQHSAPVLYAGLFLNHPTMNYVDALRFASKEYSQFKLKFLEFAANLELDRTNVADAVDAILLTINNVKNSSFPWFYSDMVPYGDNEKNVLPSYQVFDPEIRSYEITNIFQDTVISNKAVLVYITRTLDNITTTELLVKGRDYTFDQTRPAIRITDNFILLIDDVLTIVEYNNTNGSYIPETPTKLGMYPKYEPLIYNDNTLRTPRLVIQGHDGSLTPAFGDFRDSFLLELERRIYNNIKVEYNEINFNINDYIPGKFRIVDYSRQEFTQLLSQSFLRWVGTNRIDFVTNNTFQATDSFTWNFKKFKDVINGENLPGTWRSVFRYFFDTDRPHTHPWEMLGFSQMPDYWIDRYGPAPYTGGNLVLWSDLESGYIHAGPRAGIDFRYSRPGLTQIIPVDDNGNLRSPVEFLLTDFDSANANISYAVGDIGPSELAWRRSSDYPFAVHFAMALLKPARYFSLLADIQNYYRNLANGQFLSENNGHIKPASIKVNGYEDSDGTVQLAASYINWIRDYCKNLGISNASTMLHDNLSLLNVQLAYKMSGFTDKKFVELLAEQFSPSSVSDSIVVPDENYSIELYKGAPLNRLMYSAVVIEKSANGYTVSGYDLYNPYFTIVPSLPNNNSYVIEVGTNTATIFRDYKNQKLILPYGFEFSKKQQVVDFLVSYQRYLTTQGFIFEDRENQLGSIKDFVLSAKEFLHWSNQGWKEGSIIVLSPVSDTIKVFNNSAVIDEITNTPNGARVLDINYQTIKKNNFTITRESGLFSFRTLKNETIGLAVFNFVQYEHLLRLDNTTVFNDVIYVPESGNRQYRLKLIGSKTASWNGSLELPGYVFSNKQVDEWLPGVDYLKGTLVRYKSQLYTALQNVLAADKFQVSNWQQIDNSSVKTGMISNFATNASQSIQFYDIDNQPADENLQIFSNSLIGFRPREYFSNLGIDVVTQSKFYQGIIKQGGTLNAINALRGAQFNNLDTQPLSIFENWAVRVGEYGALEINNFIEFILSDQTFKNNPSIFEVNGTASGTEIDVNVFTESSVYKKSGAFTSNFLRTSSSSESVEFKPLPVAGFVNLDDVSTTVFDIKQYETYRDIADEIGTGYTIWTARDLDNTWNVYRATPIPGIVFIIRYNLDSLAEFVTNVEHGLAVNDLVVLKNFDPRYNGIYKVETILDDTRFLVTVYVNLKDLIESDAILGQGLLYKLVTSKLPTPNSIIDNAPYAGYIQNDRLWVEDIDNQGTWGVFRKSDPWAYRSTLELDQYSTSDQFGKSIAIDSMARFVYAGSPIGRVAAFLRNIDDEYDEKPALYANHQYGQVDNFGKVIAVGLRNNVDTYAAISDPNAFNDTGVVYVYKNFGLINILAYDLGAGGDQFGHALAISNDAQYLYVSAPGADKVFCYMLNYPREASVQSFTASGATAYSLQTAVTIPTDIIVTSPLAGTEFLPYIDYNLTQVNNSIVTFARTGVPTSGTATYLNVAATGGTGSGARFKVSYFASLSSPSDSYTVTLENGGSGYTAGDTLTIPGTSLGGLSPTHDITITVGTVSSVANLVFTVAPTVFLEITVQKKVDRYTLIDTLPLAAEVVPGSRFGSSLACDATGSIITVGAETASINGVANVGAAYVYHRTKTEIICNGLSNIFFLPNAFNDLYRVFVNGSLIYDPTNVPPDGSVTYTISTGPTGTVNRLSYGDPGIPILPINTKIFVDTNQFVLDEILYQQITGLGAGKFGSTLAMCSTGCNIYVASSAYKTQEYNAGLVTRFLNVGRVYGTILGTVQNPTVTTNEHIIINDRTVTFTGTSLNAVINDINNTGIVGVRAYNENNRLRITSDVVVTAQKLNIVNGTIGTPMDDLGIFPYQYTQSIKHPDRDQQFFGQSIAVDQDSGTLVIGSGGADIYKPLLIDSSLNIPTTFDGNTTTFAFVYKDSGAAFVYNLLPNPNENADNPSLFALSQKLFGPNLDDDVEFGSAVALYSQYLFVGLANAKIYDDVRGGYVHYYYNENAKNGWELSRYKQDRVDTGAVNAAFIYNINSQEIIDFFDYLDPAKGKLLGIVDQELDYKEEFDPASYNRSNRTDTINNTSFYWADRQVGRIWLDLLPLSFIDYEQDTIAYRVKNWGSLFPGSSVTIYEWVESNYLPSQYSNAVGDGVPKHADDSAYSFVTIVDPGTGVITQKYYYWVSGKTGVDSIVSKRALSVKSLESYIINPKDQNIPYLALLAPNSVAIYNASNRLSGNSVALHLDISQIRNNNLIHTEWQLVQQGAGADSIPLKAIEKLKDSLGGFDANGALVPDPLLNAQDKLGILFNPVQSMVNNRLAALALAVETLNTILAKYPVLLVKSTQALYAQDPLPTVGFDIQTNNIDDLTYIDTALLPNGYKILIPNDVNQTGRWTLYSYNATTDSFDLSKIQSYKTTLFWDAIDWYDQTYQPGKAINYIVNIYSQIQALNPALGDYIKVLDGGNGNWLLYEVLSDYSLNLIGAQNGSFSVKRDLYDASLGSGYDTLSYDVSGLDLIPTREFRNIFDGVYQQILTDELSIEFNNLFLTILNYVFIEQKNPDWVIKTSFIDVFHTLRSLDQYPNFVRDNQNFYNDYINEVKPYRTVIREYIPNYFKQDDVYNNISDFDLPSAYDSRYKIFRSPDVSLESDQSLLQQDLYVNWYNNYKFKITDYIIGNVGTGYSLPPNIEITGGGGIGASAITTINANGQVTAVIVTSAGSGYTSTPNVFVNGDGTGASLYPVLKNEFYTIQSNASYNLVRSIDTVIKFDRINYESNLIIWQPNTSYSNTVITSGNTQIDSGNIYVSSGNIIVYNNEAYLAINANAIAWAPNTVYATNSLITFNSNVYNTAGNVYASSTALINTANLRIVENFDFTRFAKLDDGNVLLNAIDRIEAYYVPSIGMPGKNVEELVYGVKYPASRVIGPEFRANAFEVRSNIISFNYEGLTINSGNVEQFNFVDLGFEINKTIKISANVPFDFQNNGYFQIISVNRDTMTLTGQPVETTYKLTLDQTISFNAGDYITQANTTGNAWVLQPTTSSNQVDVIYISPEFLPVPAGNVFGNLQIYKNGVSLGANISSITNFDKTFSPTASGGNVDVTIAYLDNDYIIDSNIYSTYLDTNLGTRPQDINIVGGAYFDMYSSHAPEELLPGRMYDALEIRMFSNTIGNTATYGFRVFQPMSSNIVYTRISANSTTTLSSNLNLFDDQILVTDATKLPEPNPLTGTPGVVFINGEKITYYQRYDAAKMATATAWTANTIFDNNKLIVLNSNVYLTTGNVYANANVYVNSANIQLITLNSLRQLRRGVDGTGAANITALAAPGQSSLPAPTTVLAPGSWQANLVTGTITANLDINSQDNVMLDVFFKPDGTKMYTVGSTNNRVYEYTLSTPWQVNTASNVAAFTTSAQEVNPAGLFFKPDGTKMYIIGTTNDRVFEYTLSTPWRVNTASNVGASVATSSGGNNETFPSALFFRPDGSSYYIIGSVADRVKRYDMTTPWQVNTAAYYSQSAQISSIEGTPTGLFFHPAGSKMFVVGQSNDRIREYDLATAWDPATITLVANSSILAGPGPSGMYWKPDGTSVFIVDSTLNAVSEYQLSPIAVSTTTNNTVVSDSSYITQGIPDAQISNTSTVTGNLHVTSNVTYKIVLGEPITANIGDYITQFTNNTGNARILSTVSNSKILAVDIVSPGFYANANLDYTLTLSQPITANRDDRIAQFFDPGTYLLELSSAITSNVGDFITQFQGNTYRLQLSSPISANVGDYITQFTGNLSNLKVIDANVVSNFVNVQFVTANVENLKFATNIGTRVNIANLYSSGGSVFSQTTANIVNITINAFSPNIYNVGNANLRVTKNVISSNVIPVQFITGDTSVIKTAANVGTRVNIADVQNNSFDFSTANIVSISLAPNVQSNLRVRANVSSSITVPVEFIVGNIDTLKTATNNTTHIITVSNSLFTNTNIVSISLEGFGSNLFSNSTSKISVVSLTSGVSSAVANIISLQPLSSLAFTNNTAYPRILLSNGNVLLSGVQVLQSNIWEQFGTTLQNSTTVGAQYIKTEPSYIP